MAINVAAARKESASEPISQDYLDEITRKLAATAEEYDRTSEFPRANFDYLAEKGLIGLTVAPQYGGRGAGYAEAIRVLGAVAKGEPSTALILFMTYAHHAQPERLTRWPRHLYERLAREAVAGGGLIGFFRVEPELGTPVRGGMPKTIARRTGDGWTITGTKIYATGSTGIDWFAVYATTDEDKPRTGVFLVGKDAPGISIEPEWDHFGMRATVSHRVVFNETPIPLDHAVDVRKPNEWVFGVDDKSLAIWNSLSISTIYDGVARAARDWLCSYLKERVPTNLGASLATLPRVQEKFGEIEALLHVNRTLLESTAQKADRGEDLPLVFLNIVKYTATSNAIRAVQIGLELTGNPGLTRKNPLERHYRDVMCSRIHSPQDDTILVGAGRAGFGL
ncbi:acyl-CoA dehydrogenase family protein [Sphingobium subterraneum]|uniref:Alkylation response protein AidB-like acyl-CoA dehydrogenase n=1 Tax=Sphingobium subterraneum TaxID=627688 RepID=A0A841J369_9SPHN|nr:acyl-CoA dehydrogenase family protein [Sphingobium subterraneum]MBB6125257.1 alkylation response protein AidB-like acyl-CoA dehydrogenase [Sphingobium subterraneum]